MENRTFYSNQIGLGYRGCNQNYHCLPSVLILIKITWIGLSAEYGVGGGRVYRLILENGIAMSRIVAP